MERTLTAATPDAYADTRAALQGKKSRGALLGSPKEALKIATTNSRRKRAETSWLKVIDITSFIAADPLRRELTKRELTKSLNAANIKTTRGNDWTMDALTRPLRKALAHIALQDEADDGPVGFDEVGLLRTFDGVDENA